MSDSAETAVLAGGCYWIMQQLLRHRDGVISTRTGFMGGENDNPTEEDNIGHAEVVEVTFDPVRLSYRGLLEVFFQVQPGAADSGRGDDPRRRCVAPLARSYGDQHQRGRGVLGDGT